MLHERTQCMLNMSKQDGRSRRHNRQIDSLLERESPPGSRSSSCALSRRKTRKNRENIEGQISNEGTVQDKKNRLTNAERMERAPLLDQYIVETVYSAMMGKAQRYACCHWLKQFAKYEERPGVLKTDKFVKCLNIIGIKFDIREQYESLADCFKVSDKKINDSDSKDSNQKDKPTQLVDYSAFVDFACNVRDSERLSEIATKLRKSISKYDGKKQSSSSFNVATGLEKLDRQKRGWITSTQFQRALQRADHGLSLHLSALQLNTLRDRFEYEYDKQQLGIDYMQFAQWLQPLLHLDTKKVHERVKLLIEDAHSKRGWQLDEVFQTMDDDKNGEIDVVELKAALLDMGLPLTDAQIRCLADEYDVDGNGKIQYYEFLSKFAKARKQRAESITKSKGDRDSNKKLNAKKRDGQKRSVRNSFSWGIHKAFARKQASKSESTKGTIYKRSANNEGLESSDDLSSEGATQRKFMRLPKKPNRTLDAEIGDKRMVKKKQRHQQRDSDLSDEGKMDSSLASDTSRRQSLKAKFKSRVSDERAANLFTTVSEQKDFVREKRPTRKTRAERNYKQTAAESDEEEISPKSGSVDTRKQSSRIKKGMKSFTTMMNDATKRGGSQRLPSKPRAQSRSQKLPRRFRTTSSPRGRRHVNRSQPDRTRWTSISSSSSDDGGDSNVSNSNHDLSSGLDVVQLRRRQQARGPRRSRHAKHTHDDTDEVPDEHGIGVVSHNSANNNAEEEWSRSDGKYHGKYHKHLKRTLRRAFDFFDLDQTSTINKRELCHVLRALGHEFTSNEVEVEMANADLDRDGQLDFYEFIAFVQRQLAQKTYLLSRQREMEIRQFFQSLDTDKNGCLNEQQFEYLIYKVLQVELSIEEQDALLYFIDKDGDGVISEEELIAFMKKLETLHCKSSRKGSWKKQKQFMDSLDTNSQLAYSAMKKLVRGAPMDINRSLLMFFGIPSNFRPAISSAATCRSLRGNTMEHVLSFPSPQTIEALAMDTTLREKKPWFTRNWLDTNSEEYRMLQIAESFEAQAIVSLKRAAGVPKPFDTREDDVIKRCVHVCLFQEQEETADSRSFERRRRSSEPKAQCKKATRSGTVVGNVHEIPVYWHQGEEDVWEFSKKTTKQDKYKFLVRTNTVNDRLYLLVEFIIHLKLENQSRNKRSKHRQAANDYDKSGEDESVEEEAREMVCCWCKVSVRHLLAKRLDILRRTEKLWGGTANAPVDIEQDELLRRRTGWRAFTNMLKKPSSPLMGIKSVPIDLLSEDLQGCVRNMPPLVIAPFVALPILAEYMILVSKTLACVAGSSSVVTCEPALKLLPKIMDDYAALSIFRKAFDTEVAGMKPGEDRHLKFQQLVLRMWPSLVQWQERLSPSLFSTAAYQNQNIDVLALTPPSGVSVSSKSAVGANLEVASQMRLNLLQMTASGKLRLQDVHVASTPFHVREVAFRRLL